MKVLTNKKVIVELPALDWVKIYNFIDDLEAGELIRPNQLERAREIISVLNGNVLNQIIGE